MAEINLKTSNFDNEVLKSELPVLVDFWATWCGPCQMMGPVVAELAEDLEGQAKICKVNVDDEPFLANQYGISVIPTFLVFKKGRVVQSIIGVKSKEELMIELINE